MKKKTNPLVVDRVLTGAKLFSIENSNLFNDTVFL